MRTLFQALEDPRTIDLEDAQAPPCKPGGLRHLGGEDSNAEGFTQEMGKWRDQGVLPRRRSGGGN